MSARLVRPASVAEGTLSVTLTNVAVGYPAYNAGTTYAVDAVVYDPVTNHEFRSLQASNTGHSLTDAAWWLDQGPTNPYRMFDQSNSSQTSNAEEIDTTVQVTGRADSISVLNMVAATVRIIMSTAEDGVLYDVTHNLVSDSGVSNWYEYFFEPVSRKGDLTIYNLPANLNPTFQIIISDPGDTAKAGEVIIGQSRALGRVAHPSNISIQDYSRKEADEFGYFTIIERSFAKLANFKIKIETNQTDSIATLFARYRATPILLVGVEAYTSTWIFGFWKDWKIDFAGPNEYYLVLEMEGLT